jgi:TRAP-type C4-dicarboxylate transport system permease small subunit
MPEMKSIVIDRQRTLKWRCLDPLEWGLMVLCGVCLTGFTTTVFLDVTTRTLHHPWLWLQEVTSFFFIYGIFVGTAVATRRNDHLYLTAIAETLTGRSRLVLEIGNRLVIAGVAICMIYFGYLNFLDGFHSFRMPSTTPIALLYAPIPISGCFVLLFAIEQIVNGWRNGFETADTAIPHMTALATGDTTNLRNQPT